MRTFELLPQDFENTSSLRGTRGKTDIFRRQDCTMDVQKESKTNPLRTSEGYLFRACCIAREAAAITRVLTETQRQAEEWEGFRWDPPGSLLPGEAIGGFIRNGVSPSD